MQGEGGEDVANVDRELLEEKNETIADLRKRVDGLEEQLGDVQEERDELATKVERLRSVEERVEEAEQIEEQLESAREALGVDVAGDSAVDIEGEELRAELQQREETINELKTKIDRLQEQGYSLDEEFESKMDFIQHEAVREEIERAASKSKCKDDHTWDVLSVLIDKESATGDEIAPYCDVTKTSVQNILSKLAEQNVVAKTTKQGKAEYSLNVDGMREIIQQQRKRAEMSKLKDQVKN